MNEFFITESMIAGVILLVSFLLHIFVTRSKKRVCAAFIISMILFQPTFVSGLTSGTALEYFCYYSSQVLVIAAVIYLTVGDKQKNEGNKQDN